MAHLPLEDGWTKLQPFATSWVHALLDYVDEMNHPNMVRIRAPMRRRAFCSTLHDFWYSRMEESPDHGKRFECRTHRGQRYLSVQDEVIIRVKQLDPRYLSWNLATTHADAWNRQMALKGLEPAPRLELGYRLDAVMSGYDNIHILLRVESEIDWRIQIYGARTDTFDVGQLGLDGIETHRTHYAYRPVRIDREGS